MDPDGLLSRIAPYAACCIVSALVFLILGWAAAKKGARLPGWLSALANRLGGLGNQEAVTEEQLLDLVDDAGEQEVIDDDQAEMISSVVELADVTAGHIMTHRTDMTALEENMPCREAVETAFRRRVEGKLDILSTIAQSLEKARAALDDGIDPDEEALARHRQELEDLIDEVRDRLEE